MAQDQDPLSAERVMLAAVSVSVQAIKVDNKQMTQAVFKQLAQAALLDEDAHFRGIAWGRVNFHWGGCEGDHEHVVWQLGSELRRDDFYIPYRSEKATRLREERSLGIGIGILRLVIAGNAVSFTKEGIGSRGYGDHHNVHVNGWYMSLENLKTYTSLKTSWGWPMSDWAMKEHPNQYKTDAEAALKGLEELGALDDFPGPPEEIAKQCEQLEAEAKQLDAALRDAVSKIRALPQLFIAV